MLRGFFPLTIALAVLAALLVFGCKADGGAGGVLLGGDPDSLAIDAVRDFDSGDRHSKAEVTEASNGARVVRTKVDIEFSMDATVGEVNALLESVEGLITSMLEGVNLMVVRIPDPESLEALNSFVAALESDPAVVRAYKTYMAVPDVLPDNYSGQEPDDFVYIDHHLAVRAHAAWNAKAALKGASVKPPLLIVEDYFGDGAPNGDTDVKAPAGLFATNDPYKHGYHILGVIAAKHGGGASDRGRATGIYPGSLDLYPLDQTFLDDQTTQNILIAQIKSANRKVVVNKSLGELCDLTVAECLIDGARKWIKRVRGSALYELGTTGQTSLEKKFLHFTSAGNQIAPGPPDAELNSPENAARLMTDLETEAGKSLANLDNTLVIENRDVSSAEPYKATCLADDSKYPGNLSAIGIDVWSLTGASAGADDASGTSQAAPQAAGLAAYVWALAPNLSPQAVLSILINTSRAPTCGSGGAAGHPVIDAYSAVLAVDGAAALAGGGASKAPVRLAILDIVGGNKDALGGNGAFNEHDVERFLDELTWTPDRPDYSRFDLNGDGFTGGKTSDRLNLDIDPALSHGEVTQDIKGSTVKFNENNLTDMKVLCYYAYSDLYTGDDAKRDTLMQPWLSECKGRTMAFMRTPLDTVNIDVYTMSEDGGGQTPITDWGGQFRDSWGLAWSPDGEKLAASLPVRVQSFNYYDLILVNADGSGWVNITETSNLDEAHPAWHPDGAQIAYTDWDAINILTIGGGRSRLPTSSNYTRYTPEHPSFSPDGTKLAFFDWQDTGGYVFVHDFNSEQTTELGVGWSPAWSPDGAKIAFAGGDNWQEVWIMNSDGSGRTKLYGLPGEYDYTIRDIAWAPGDKIAFDAEWYAAPEPYSNDYDIYVINPDGTGFTNITDTLGTYEQYPTWAP